MKEIPKNREEFHPASLEAALREYFRLLHTIKIDETIADAIRTDAVLRLHTVLVAAGRPTFIPAVVAEDEIMPPTLRESGLGVDDWLDQLRLAPLRLLARGMPEQELMSAEYASGAIYGAMHKAELHTQCLPLVDMKNGETSCSQAVCCPRLVARSSMLLIIALLIQDRFTYDPDDRFDKELIASIDEKISVIRYELMRSNVVGQYEITEILSMLYRENKGLSVESLLAQSPDDTE